MKNVVVMTALVLLALQSGCDQQQPTQETKTSYEAPPGSKVKGLDGTSTREAKEGYPAPQGTEVKDLNGTPVSPG